MDEPPREGFLRRWARLKEQANSDSAASRPAHPEGDPPQLPPLDELTFESDYGGFFHPKVDEALRRAALRKLFSEPHFNVMDGLDVYIDDYSKPDPIAPGVLERLAQMGFVRDAGAAAETAPPTAASIPERAMPAPETPQGAQLSEVAAPALPANAPDASVDPVAAEKSPQVRPEP